MGRNSTLVVAALAGFAGVVCGCANVDTINIATNPDGAKLYVNGQFVGPTPQTVPLHWQPWPFSAETLNLRMEKAGCATQTDAISAAELTDRFSRGQGRPGSQFGSGATYTFAYNLRPASEPASAGGQAAVHCDLRVIAVKDGTALASASDENTPHRLEDLARSLAHKLKDATPVKGRSISVVSLRNRSGTNEGRAIADELADKVVGALIGTQWFDVKERIDLRPILGEKDLEGANILKNPQVQGKLAGVEYIVIGGVTVTEPK
jgi:TolB-like protein